jgi:hypothetical protein
MRKCQALQTSYAWIAAVTLILLPVTWLSPQSPAVSEDLRQFDTPIPPTPDFKAPFTATPPVATPIPTVGPGQSFDEDQEELLPDVIRPDLLRNSVGYSELAGRPGLFLVWSTDEDGNKRYFVIDESDRYFPLIRAEVDRIMTARDAMRSNLSMSKFLGGGIIALALGGLGTACGVGAIVSLAAEPISAPVTGALTACAGSAFSFAAGALGLSLDGLEAMTTYERTYRDASRQIEAYISQLP